MKIQDALIASSENLLASIQSGHRPSCIRDAQKLIEITRDHLQALKDLAVTLSKHGDARRARSVTECAAKIAECLCRLEIDAAVIFGIHSTRIKIGVKF